MQYLTRKIQDLYSFDLKLVVIPYISPSNYIETSERILCRSKKKLQTALLLSNFKTKHETKHISTSLVTLGSNQVSKEVEFIKIFNFLGFRRYFSTRIEKTFKKHPKISFFSLILDVFEDCAILAQKQRLKLRKLNFAASETLLDPLFARSEMNLGSKNPMWPRINANTFLG